MKSIVKLCDANENHPEIPFGLGKKQQQHGLTTNSGSKAIEKQS